MKVSAFQRHVIEMTLSMLIPMSILVVTFNLLLPGLGVAARPGLGSAAGFVLLAGALLGMTLPMVGVMRVRGHSWGHVGEMVVAMFVPVAIVMPVMRIFLPAAGIQVSQMAMAPVAFVAMTGGMIVLMFFRRGKVSSG